SKNTKNVDDAIGQGVLTKDLPSPNIHQMYEITANYIPNPYNRINFFVTGGMNLFLNDLNKQKSQKIGISFGVGVTGNIWESPWGLLSASGEFRVNTEIGREDNLVFIEAEPTIVPISNLISMPRFTLQFYPKLR